MAKKHLKKFGINNYRYKKLGKSFLVTTDSGGWCFLSEKEMSLLKKRKIDEKKLFELLEKEGIIITEKNENEVIEAFRNRNSFLWQGASLHIIVPTLRCNMNCIYCHASSKPLNARNFDMSRETARKAVEFIFQSPSRIISIEFQGGEPLLRFDLVKGIIEYAKKLNRERKKNLDFSLVTNLSLMDNEKMRYFVQNNVGICTSLDGPKKVHDRNRKFFSGSSHMHVAKWAKKINMSYKSRNKTESSGRRHHLDALMTVTRYSLPYWKEIVDEYLKNGIKNLSLRPLHNLGYASGMWKEIGYTAEEFIEFWKKAMDYILKLNREGVIIRERVTKIILEKLFEPFDPAYLDLRSPCGAAIGQLLYDYDGKIYTCDEGRMLGQDIFKIGNVKKDSYRKVLTSGKVCSIVAASVNDLQICDYCVYKPFCGLCPVCNYAYSGSILGHVVETDRCKIFKAQFDYVFRKIKEDKQARELLLDWIKTNKNE